MRVEERYLQALLSQPAMATVPLAGREAVSVEQVYVSRTLLQEVKQKKIDRGPGGGAGPEREITVKLPVDVWAKLREQRVLLIEGPAGMGKSTLSKQLVRESVSQQKLIPIWIACRDWMGSRLILPEYLEQRYVAALGLSGIRVPYKVTGDGPDRSLGQWLYEQWVSGLGMLILDGLDEVFVHQERVEALRTLPITGIGPTRPATILTSRPLSQAVPLTLTTIELQGLTPQDQTQLIKRYQDVLQLTEDKISGFRNEVQQKKEGRILELLRRPGHLMQLLTSYAQSGILPTTETEILAQLLQSRLTITGRSAPPVKPDDPSKKQQVLTALALHFLACRQGQWQTRAQILTLIRQVLEEWKIHGAPLLSPNQATALLNDFVRNSGLLTEVEPEVYQFETVIWLQHLTGCALADKAIITTLGLKNDQVLEFLDKKAWDPEWEPVLMSWVGTAQNSLPLFTCLMDEKEDDMARHRLGTAARCLFEVNPLLKDNPEYQVLSVQIPTTAFEVWLKFAESDKDKLVESSLRRSWVETDIGRERLKQFNVNMDRVYKRDPFLLRHDMVRKLGKLDSPVSEIIQQALVTWLEDEDRHVRKEAVVALGRFGAAIAISIQQALVKRLEDSDKDVRRATVEALIGMGVEQLVTSPVPIQQAFLERFEGSDETVLSAVLWSIEEQGVAMPVWIQQALVARLDDANYAVRVKAVEALGGLGQELSAPMQQALVARLEDSDETVRMAVLCAVGEFGVTMPAWIQQVLVARLKDANSDVRTEALEGILGGSLHLDRPIYIPELIHKTLVRLLEDQDGYVREMAAEALERFGAAMSDSIQQVLVVLLEDSDEAARKGAEKALMRLGAGLCELVREHLLAKIKHEEWCVRESVVNVLGNLSPSLPALVQEALASRLDDANHAVRRAAVNALGKLGAELSAPMQQALVARLEDSDKDVRTAVVWALGGLGVTMSAWIQQVLVAQLEDSNGEVREAVARVLGRLGPTMPSWIQQAIVARLNKEWWSGMWLKALVEALGDLGQAMPDWIQKSLLDKLEALGWYGGDEFVRALLKSDAVMPESFQQRLVNRLGHWNEILRKEAIDALGRLRATMTLSIQEALVRRLEVLEWEQKEGAVEVLSFAQNYGLRLFLSGATVRSGQLVTNLSATTPFTDGCLQNAVRPSSFLRPYPRWFSVPWWSGWRIGTIMM